MANIPVGIKRDVMPTQDWKEFFFASSDECIVVSLIYIGFGIPSLLADLNESLHFGGGIVGHAKFLELALFQSIVHCFCGFLKWRLAIR
jgi:hypothetical protein